MIAPVSDVFRLPGYFRFWLGETLSGFGTYITTVALQVLVVLTLGGGAAEVGLVNAARWLPYLLFGLVVGALVEGWRRKPVLVSTDLARGVLLAAVPLLWIADALTLPALLVVVALVGALTLLNDSASQSFVPRLVPRDRLLPAHSRLDQSGAVAQTSGPALGGALVSLLGAPFAVLVDALSYLASAVLMVGVRVAEPRAERRPRGRFWRDVGDGLRWVYRHRMLAPLAVSTHGWFLVNSLATTVFVTFVLLELSLTPFELGLALSAAGAAGLGGALLSTRLGTRFGAGPVVIACRAAMPVGWAVIALAPAVSPVPALVVLMAGQALIGFAMGAENANEMAYRQVATPDALQARTNTTMRSINRAAIVVGAPLGGLLADAIGYRPALWLAVAGFAVVAAGLAASPFRRARHGDQRL